MHLMGSRDGDDTRGRVAGPEAQNHPTSEPYSGIVETVLARILFGKPDSTTDARRRVLHIVVAGASLVVALGGIYIVVMMVVALLSN
jgi:hypothetical protein